MRAAVLEKACIRCGLCEGICPAVFTLPDDGGCARAVDEKVPTEEQSGVRTAADSCPTAAIVIRQG